MQELERMLWLWTRMYVTYSLSLLSVGHWINQRSLCVLWHGLTFASRGFLSLVMRLLTNTCGFWSNGNHDYQQVVSEHRSRVRYTPSSRWGEIVGHWISQCSCVSRHGLYPPLVDPYLWRCNLRLTPAGFAFSDTHSWAHTILLMHVFLDISMMYGKVVRFLWWLHPSKLWECHFGPGMICHVKLT